MSTKTSRFKKESTGVILVASNPEALAMFDGKTLNEIGFENNLADEDIEIAHSKLPNGTKVKALMVKVNGKTYVVPFSRSFPEDKLNDADYLLDCMFRKSFVSAKEEDGITAKSNPDGSVVLDESRPYMSFGKPQGITFDTTEQLFKDVDVKKAATASVA